MTVNYVWHKTVSMMGMCHLRYRLVDGIINVPGRGKQAALFTASEDYKLASRKRKRIMFDNDVLVIQHTLSSCNKCIFIHWMNTLIITDAVLIIKGETTVQLRISAVLLRKAGRWDVPYANIYKNEGIKG